MLREALLGGPLGGLLGMVDVLGKFRQERKLRRKAVLVGEDDGRTPRTIRNGVVKVTPAVDEHLGTLVLAFELNVPSGSGSSHFAVTRNLWGEPEEAVVTINGDQMNDADLDVDVGTRGPFKVVVTFAVEWTDDAGENALEVASVLSIKDLL